MSDGWRKIETTVRYRGLDVTVIGEATAGLFAIAGYGTRDERAIGTIAVKRRGDCSVYSLGGAEEWTPSVEAVVDAVVRARQARDACAD
jgi:hypothetical protein